ncbi:UDP-2-acetamido-2,6-beta-L-arabino-hexul-4-ose reductase [bioreactor metagenome]|uniref:UDP-2-acetamido-2,6-beta-L-arabino-hexul-4-ose reductase n=1 Tax=bioreactor metagenome TaxID=1076179 RepID=A0A644VQ91_9ZZZZ
MIRVGITGQAGFVGTHLYNHLGLAPDKYERIPFEDHFFSDTAILRGYVRQCDVIVHLAAMNRHTDPQVIYDINIGLVKQLIDAMEAEKVTPHVLFSSSIQEELDNLYGQSKKDGRELLEKWAIRNKASFTGLVVPNVYGEFSRPNYNTFIATFAHKLINGEQPQIITDSSVKLIYVGSLFKFIIGQFENNGVVRVNVPSDFERKVSSILSLFEQFNTMYANNGFIPNLADINEVNLFNTFRSYLDYKNKFPVKLVKHIDNRGVFVETIKLGVGGQVSFSTTLPGVTRGNHYHTRKIERFTVIRGKARIQLRKIGSDEVMNFYLDGNEPSYVDMPVWFTHNITNIGDEELYTQFWINEWYNPEDGDTYFEEV